LDANSRGMEPESPRLNRSRVTSSTQLATRRRQTKGRRFTRDEREAKIARPLLESSEAHFADFAIPMDELDLAECKLGVELPLDDMLFSRLAKDAFESPARLTRVSLGTQHTCFRDGDVEPDTHRLYVVLLLEHDRSRDRLPCSIDSILVQQDARK